MCFIQISCILYIQTQRFCSCEDIRSVWFTVAESYFIYFLLNSTYLLCCHCVLCEPHAFQPLLLIIYFKSHCQYQPQNLLGAQSPDWNMNFSSLCLGSDKVWGYSEACWQEGIKHKKPVGALESSQGKQMYVSHMLKALRGRLNIVAFKCLDVILFYFSFIHIQQ